MEVLLNVVWVAIACVALWCWRRRAHRGNPLAGLVALGCALLLLFPAISISDDLHGNVLTEDTPTKQKVQRALSHPSNVIACQTATVELPQPTFHRAFVDVLAPRAPKLLLVTHPDLRGPPRPLL